MAGKKAKLVPASVDDQRQAEGALAEIAMLERRLRAVEDAFQADVDALKEKARAAAAPLRARLKELSGGVKKWALMNKAALFTERKSLDLGFGEIGFRAGTSIVQMDNVTEAESVALLLRLGFAEGLRVVHEINKPGMTDWTEDRLALVGLRRRTADTYYCEIHKEKVGP